MVHSPRRRNLIKGIGATGLAGLTGCLGGSGGSTADAKVGVLQPTTGELGSVGKAIMNAGALPGAQLENAGVDYTIDIEEKDTESVPEVALSQAESLVNAGYPAITGAANSASTIELANDILYQNEIVAISPASTSPEITKMSGDYLLRTAPSDDWQGKAMAEIAYNEQDADTMATFYLNNDYGQGLAEPVATEFEALGGTVTAQEAFESGQPSYSSALETVFADDPDIVLLVSYPESGQVILRDFYADIDDGTTFLVPDGLKDPKLPTNVDNSLDNVIGTAPAAAGPGVETFEQLYKDEYGAQPGVFTAQAYDATAVLILATLAAREVEGSAIAKEVRPVANPGGTTITPDNLAKGLDMAAQGDEIQYEGASSAVDFAKNGDMKSVTYEIFGFTSEGVTRKDVVEFEA